MKDEIMASEEKCMEIHNKYKIEHTDGTPLKGKKYFVLRLDSDDPMEAARVARAMRAYEGKPRNCDMYQDGQSAYNGWRDSFRDKRSPELLFSDWILETAKEKTDGSK